MSAASYWIASAPVTPTLRRQVESLIISSKEGGTFIQAVVHGAARQFADSEPRPEGVGPYRVIRDLGHGGMGAVYLAARADDEYQKQVAIKLLKGGIATSEMLRRFRSERQILASLDHPNIARLLDGGTTESGGPYVVMEYVEGEPIDEYADRNKLTTEERLRLFRKVCAAVQYAHQNLIVHRDIKPGNMLVTADGEPKLLDFGIAKLLKPDGIIETLAETRADVRLMTPEYASPEQARGEPISTASDIYSLGVALYELLTGHRPYQLKSSQPRDVERAICEQEPEKPSTAVARDEEVTTRTGNVVTVTAETLSERRGTTAEKLRRRLRGDLDNIVMMALRKEPARRYASVEQFSEDIGRHLEGLPVLARRATLGYRAQKFAQRHRLAVAATAGVLIIIAALVGFYTWRLAAERDRAQLEAAKARQVSDFLVRLFEVSDPSQSKGETITAKELLDRGAAQVENELAGQPEVQATMMAVMGRVYLSLALHDQARPLLERSLETRRTLYGEKNSDVAESLLSMGLLFYRQGDYDQAESFHRQGLAVNRELFGDGHPAVAKSLNHLATALSAKKDNDAAESIFRQVIDLRRKLHGDEHPDVLTNLSSLASVLIDKGDNEGAESTMREIIDLRRKLSGENDLQLSIDINNLAAARYLRGDLASAEPLFRESLSIRRKLLGEEHPDVAEGMNNLAVLLRDKGAYDEAESLLRQTVEIETRRRGADHWYVAYYQTTLALVLQAKGDYGTAEPMFRGALATYRKTFQEDNSYTAAPLLGLGSVLIDKGEPESAEPLLRRCLAIYQQRLPDGHWHTAMARSVLGHCLARMGQFEEAEPLLLDSYSVMKSSRGEQSRASRDCLNRIISLYETWGRTH